MKKLLLSLFLVLISFSSYAQLSGDYYIPQGANPQGFATLASAIDSLNKVGLSGTVYFYIDDNLAETGSLLRMYRGDLSAANNLVIKPAPTKTPTITITSCASTGRTAFVGITLDSTSYVTFDGSNTVGGTTRDLTISLNDASARIGIQLYGNADAVAVKNLIIKYGQIPGSTSTSRGIYVNGQSTGVTDGFTVENCLIGDGTFDPAYAVSVTGYGTAPTVNASNVVIKNNILYGTLRRVYFYFVGTVGTPCEISGNRIYGLIAPPDANVVWGILFNTYNGTINVFNNVLNSLRQATTGTQGVYGFGTLNGQGSTELNIYNNFFGGDFIHSGTGIPASVDVISFQDAAAGAKVKIYYNTVVLNNMTKSASGRMTCLRFNPAAGSTFDIQNNIFVDKRDGIISKAIMFGGSTTTFTSNHNDIFVSGVGANIGNYNGTDRLTLTDWQTASGQDANSVSKDVLFVSDTDFHLTGTSNGDLDLLATPIAGITTDIDGNTRSKLFPYKGADEGTIKLLPPLAGDYYIGAPGTGPGGTDPQFATLREAFDVLNDATFAGDCHLYITSDITETYTPAVGLGLAINPTPYTVTFKPYTGVQPVITLNYPSDLNGGPSGALVIGIPSKGNISWDSLRTTKNIVIDGSNTVDGTTRDLTIQSALTAQRNAFPLTIVGDVSNMVVKNTNIYYRAQGVSTSGNLFVSAVMLRSRNYLNKNWVPRDILFENNHISANFDGVVQSAQGYGCYQSGTPNVLDYPHNITLKNNLIEGKRRAIALYKAGSHDIVGNIIVLNQNIVANTTNEAIYAVDVDTNAVINIYDNRISKISSITNAANNGNTAISIETFGTYNIYNNMIYGFELTAANPVAYLRGIKNSSASATLNLNFNSIYMNNLADIGTGAVTYQGILLSDGINSLANNIVVSAEPDFPSYCIYRSGTAGAVTSNYNDFYAADATNGNVGFWDVAATKSLTDWQTASSLDANSISADPLFVSATDLHLQNISSPVMGKGIAIPGITSDIDGETRDDIPEIGADDFPGVIPVELVSFTASLEKNNVVLKWQTATELNSSYFSIERKVAGSEWTSIGRVNAAGNSTNPVEYRFVDEKVVGPKSFYRLKQVDFDGSYSFSKEVEVNTEMPTTFALSQNYPNPFNPTTKINYSVPFDSKVTISIYSVTGELVKELVNDFVAAGSYSVDFNGSDLASGMYIYRMVAGSFVQTHKMMLLK